MLTGVYRGASECCAEKITWVGVVSVCVDGRRDVNARDTSSTRQALSTKQAFSSRQLSDIKQAPDIRLFSHA